MAQNEKFTNIIGVPFKQYVSEQLITRAQNISQTEQRTENNILFLANKNCWIKLTSFVTVEGGYAGNLSENTPKGTFLAENWTLFGGTSYLKEGVNNLRFGIEQNPILSNDPYANNPDVLNITNASAYALGGIQEQGYKIMPGITSAKIQHTGTAGSLRAATINFYVGNKQQLDIIDMLYFRLGYSCLLEWGHTSYLDNKGKLESNIFPIDIFDLKTISSKEDVLFKINEKKQQTNGNYDAMYGMVNNYEWNLNTDGGYECNVKLIGLGSVIDSLKINQSFSMPNGEYKGATQNKTNGYTQQSTTPVTNVPIPKGPVIENNQIIYAQSGVSYKLDGTQNVLVNYEELLKAQSTSYFNYRYLVKSVEKQQPRQTLVGEPPKTIASVNYNGELLLKKELLDVKKCVLSKTGKTFKVYDPDDKTQDALNSFTQEDFPNISIGSSKDDLKKIQFKIELTDDKKSIRLTGDLPLEQPKEFVYESGVSPDDSTVPRYSIATCDTVRIVYHIPYDTFIKNIGIVYPPFSDTSAKLQVEDAEGNRISFPALVKFYYQFLIGPFKNIKPLEDDGGSLKITLDNIKPTNKDNILDLSVDIIITDSKDRGAGERVKQTKNFLKKIFDAINNTKNNIDNSDLYNVTELPISDIDFASTSYKNKNIKKTFNLARIFYNYDASKFNNSSNTNPEAPGEDLAVPASTLPTTIMSNVDKFLIELRDETGARGSAGGKIDLYDFITDKMKTGALDKIRIDTENDINPLLRSQIPTDAKKRLGYFIKKGFNSEIISGEKFQVGDVPNVDFRELFTAYYAGITDNQDQGLTSKYIYIKLGLLLYYINNSSLLYEKNAANDTENALKKPFVYIDFNPESNFCLTTKFHFSVDPSVCLIPVNISKDGYKSLFPNIKINDNDIFKTSLDNVSRFINTGFSDKTAIDESRGKIMNIAVNIDHVINIIQSQAKSNPESNVYLRPFIETLVSDINKSLGNINKFRVGYYDDGNTVRIYDDQYINPPSGQSTIKNDTVTIPIYGRNSIARNITLKTGVSTAMSNQIAISSQAGNLGELNIDASSLGNINSRLLDRLMRVKEVAANPVTSGSASPADDSSAAIFNDHLVAIYNQQENNKSNAEIAKNYYCTVANKLKANLPSTSIKPVLPLELNVTMDGISGMSLLEGFTIPTDLLPMQYLTNGLSKVGFAIMGLDHSIEGNQWTTNIKGQMINLPDPKRVLSSELGAADVGAGGAPPRTSSNFVYENLGPPVPIGQNPLLKNQEFLNRVGEIARKYGFNPEEMLKCFHAESGISTTAQNWQGIKGVTSGPNRYRLVAAGIMQWTYASGFKNYKSSKKYGVKTTEDILKLSAMQQLEMADEYFDGARTYINRMSTDERSSFFGLYLLVFFPTLAGKPDNTIAKSNFTAEQVSQQNAGIAIAAGKTPGTPLTKGDFRKYCAKAFNRKLPAGLKFS